MNHEINTLTISDLAKCCVAGRRIDRRPLPERGIYYFEETFLIDGELRDTRQRLFWLMAKTIFWSIGVPVRRRLPLIGHRHVSAAFGLRNPHHAIDAMAGGDRLARSRLAHRLVVVELGLPERRDAGGEGRRIANLG
jgi:hypothetical protein